MSKRAAKLAGSFFAIMAGASIGFITMASFMIVFPELGIWCALVAGISGSLTEGEVYWGGVRKSFKEFFTVGPFASLRLALIKREIQAQLKDDANKATLIGLIEDIRHDRRLELLTCLDVQPEELAIFKKLTATKFVLRLLTFLKDKNLESLTLTPELKALYQKLQTISESIQEKAFVKKLKRKHLFLSLALMAAFGTGIGFGAITFTHVAAGLLALGGFSALTAVTPFWVFLVAGGFAFFAAVGYGLLMYHMLAKAVEGNLVQRSVMKLKTTFIHEKWDTLNTSEKIYHLINCFFKALVLAVIVGISILVTIGTAGAWLNSSSQFFSFIATGSFETINFYASLASNILIWGFFFPVTLLFATENSIVSVQQIWSKLVTLVSSTCRHNWDSLKERWKYERMLQFINPFRFIAAALDSIAAMAALLLHVISSGVIPGEGSEGGAIPIPGVMMTALGAVSEFLADFHFAAHLDDHDHHHEKPIDDLNKDPDEEHHHHHSLASILLLPITFPLKLLGFGWHNLMGEQRISWKDYVHLRYEPLYKRVNDQQNSSARSRSPSDNDLKTTQVMPSQESAPGDRKPLVSSAPALSC